MNSVIMQDTALNNVERPFTELFSILKKYEHANDTAIKLSYSQLELTKLHAHSGNAIDLLLIGLRSIGGFISFASGEGSGLLADSGHLISLISDLIDALMILRIDVDAAS